MNRALLFAILVLILVCCFGKNIESFHGLSSCVKACSGWDCPLPAKYPLVNMYNLEGSDCKLNHMSPYYKRTFPDCNPLEPNGCDKYPSIEYFHNLPKASCQPGCGLMNDNCNTNSENPRWKNSRFWNKQESAPELIGESQWYPTPNMTS